MYREECVIFKEHPEEGGMCSTFDEDVCDGSNYKTHSKHILSKVKNKFHQSVCNVRLTEYDVVFFSFKG